MVFNITKEKIRGRMSDVDQDVWPTPGTRAKEGPKLLQLIPLITGPSRQTLLTMPDVVDPIYDEVNKKYGTSIQPLTESAAFKGANAAMQLKRSMSNLLNGKSEKASESPK